MGQHLLLTMVAAPLLLLGNPLPLVLWGLPPVSGGGWRRRSGRARGSAPHCRPSHFLPVPASFT